MYLCVLEMDPKHAFALTNLGTLMLLSRGDEAGENRPLRIRLSRREKIPRGDERSRA